MHLRFVLPAALVVAIAFGARAQVIQFESNGLKFQTLSKTGLTVMFAHLPMQLRDYSAIQAGVSNGAKAPCNVKPEDFSFRREDGTMLYAMAAKDVVTQLLGRASRNDVAKLISTYEMSLSGVGRLHSTNGYEQRRQAALAEMGGSKLQAAAAASAIAFVPTKLEPGESTDGAVFFHFTIGMNDPVVLPNAPDAILVTHPLAFTRLKALYISNRNCRLAFSLKAHGSALFLANARSCWANPGPRYVSRPRLPPRSQFPGPPGGSGNDAPFSVFP
jgi:hypothetical protein